MSLWCSELKLDDDDVTVLKSRFDQSKKAFLAIVIVTCNKFTDHNSQRGSFEPKVTILGQEAGVFY